jgi:hypothetical protein
MSWVTPLFTDVQHSKICEGFGDCDGTLSFDIVIIWATLLLTYVQNSDIFYILRDELCAFDTDF